LIHLESDEPLSDAPLLFELFGINYGLLNISSIKYGELLIRYFFTEVANHVIDNVPFDPEQALVTAEQRTNKLLINNPWIPGSPVAVESRVAIKQAPKPRKVSNKDRAIELFAVNKHLDNKQLVQLFVNEIGMTKSGANTYAYNVRNIWVNE
jgi:hypothetical protein